MVNFYPQTNERYGATVNSEQRSKGLKILRESNASYCCLPKDGNIE